MERGRVILSVCLIFILAALPGCAGRKRANHTRTQKNNLLKTSIDLPTEIRNEKLSRFGISSSEGELIAQEEAERISPEPAVITTETMQEKKEEEKAAKEKTPAQEAAEAIEQEPSIEFNFENADLETLINQISDLFDITFIADDSITPMLQGAKSVKGNKISFKTQRPMTKKEAWDLFLAFLEISGFTAIDQSNPKIKRIVTLDLARKSPLPAYIGVSHLLLPNSDEMVRYVYFIENMDMPTIEQLMAQLRSPTSSVAILREMKAFLITDKAYNIKSLMNIIKELDKTVMPQAMSVIKLKRADAEDIEKLYKSLAGTSDKELAQQRFFPGRKSSPAAYFPDNVGIFAEKRGNSLILLGPVDSIKRIEEFIKQLDTDIELPYSPLQVLPLRYADAITISKIMNDVTRFGANTEAGKSGGVRGGDKYLKPMSFIPEPETNRIIVKGDYEDFLKAKEIILKLDAPQPQVAIEVLLLSVALNDKRQLGAQIRSRVPGTEGLLGTAKFQTSGLFGTSGIVENPNGPGIDRLLGNLLNLVSTGVAAGNTIISLGDSLNVWGIVQALQTASNVQVLANPFLIATNKTNATVSLGEIRRVTTGTIVGTQDVNTVGDAPAELKVNIIPQINSDGMIVLDISVSLSQFVGSANPDAAVRTARDIKTKTIVTNKEVLALGGLIQNDVEDIVTKVPVLGDIPILGWLFKNKTKIASKSNLLILISSRIIEPDSDVAITAFTNDHITDYTDTLNEMYIPAERRDPINRWFFAGKNLNEIATDEFIYRQQKEALSEAKLKKDIVTPIVQNDAAKNEFKKHQQKNAVMARSSRRWAKKNKETRA